MRRLRGAFITGILILVPIFATIKLFLSFIGFLDRNTREYLPRFIFPVDFPGLGLILGIAIIVVFGLLAQNFVGKWIVEGLDQTVRKIPLGGGIYSAIKKFLETIFNPRDDRFKGAVLVEFPRTGIYSIGFRTGVPDIKLVKKLPAEKMANVFVPCTPNPTSGFYLLVPEDKLISLNMSVQEAFKIVISMGLVTSDDTATQ